MLLKIRTLSCPPPDTPESIHAQFGAAGGRIGRSPPCTLILPDPNRHISREHAEIRFRADAFSLKVVSKVNSVLVNGEVVSPGEAVPLGDGDQILIGEYLLRAEVVAQPSAPPPAAAPFMPAPAVSGGNPFDMFDSLAAPRPAAAAPEATPDWFRTPAANPQPAPQAVAGSGLDEFFHPTPDASKFSDLMQTTPPPSAADAFPPAAPAAPVDSRLDQFLGLNDPTALDTEVSPLGGSADLYRASPLDMPLQAASIPSLPPRAAPAPSSFGSHDDIFKSLEQDFGALPGSTAPPSVPEPPPVRPPPPLPVPPTPPLQPPAAAPPTVAPAPRVPPPLQDDELPTPPLRSRPAAPQVAPTAFAGGEQAPDSTARATAAAPGPAPQPPAPPAAAFAPSPVAAQAAVGRDAADVQHLMQVLVEALGLNPGDVDTSHPEQTIRLVGELLRLSTDGLFRLLEMRSQLKSELHIEDRTMIASRENNPLKHADTARDAIAHLVDLRQHGNRLFMPPVKAVEDTIWDICAHEMAVMAGTRAALLAALKMFSPEVIEGRIKKTGALENVLPALHKSRLWERFLGMYAELQTEAEDHFDRLLNQEFSKAYSEQSKKLKKKR